MPYNFAAESFHTKKRCSSVSSRKVQFSVRKTKKIVASDAPFGGLGATYAVHLRLIGKLVGDFLLVIIEFFSLHAYVLSQFTHLTDGWTGRRTVGQMLIRKTALHKMQRGKNYFSAVIDHFCITDTASTFVIAQ